MKAQTITKNIFIISIAAAIVFACAYGFVFYKIASAMKEFSAKSAEIARKLAIQQQNESRSAVMEATAPSRDKLDSYFVGKDNVVDFLSSIEALGRKNGVALQISNVGLSELPELGIKNAGDAAELLKMNIEITGSWARAYNFLSALSYMPYALGFDSVEMTTQTVAVGAKKTAKEWRANISASVLKLK